jgi:Ca2+-binding RTX toxin-like protein
MRTVLAAAVLLLALPATALAGRAERGVHREYDQKYGEVISETGSVTYVGSPGEANRVTITVVEGGMEILDGAGAEAGAGCAQLAPGRVRCPDSTRLYVRAGDGDDVVTVTSRLSTLGVDGQDGADRITSDGALDGGPGDDVLRAGRYGASMTGGPGADELVGGPGTDGAGYAGALGPVHADLEGDADDGEAGEGDRIDASVENIIGSVHADVLIGNDAANQLLAVDDDRPQLDRVVGGAGDDRVSGGGEDVLLLGPGDDDGSVTANGFDNPEAIVDGGPGDDSLTGSLDGERLRGGPGRDELDGNGGDDVIEALDGEPDGVYCMPANGPPGGTVSADVVDLVQYCLPQSIRRPGPARVHLEYASRSDAELVCPSDHGPWCRGRLRLVRRGRTVVVRPFAVAHDAVRAIRWFRDRELTRGRYTLYIVTRNAAGRPIVLRRTFTVAGRRP